MELLLALAVIAGLDVLALRFGRDSRHVADREQRRAGF